MLFQNLFPGPAFGPVELGDHWLVVFNANLIDAIFIAVQSQEAAITDKAKAFNRINQQVGAEAFKWMGL